ncbi:hypothetical protein BDM02DRAFT_3117180 [Thelephora ganbajun]|uniref:Uncharacterized protein n=1 Tax=Thelephora ganbajun TaxID=370292 RepID=A0ACB6ZDX2_THEGA|nr:hypothetical protein BDM02DRAFT_3117180 [Thelephora ganbajun]
MPSVARPPVIVANAKPPVQRKPKGPERKWTSREDEILINAVSTYTTGEKINWIKIAELIEGRSNKACRKRWIHSLNPTLRKGRWTIQEDELLLKAIRKHGHCWHKVAKYLPGRTDDQAAKRFREKLDPGIAKTPWTEEEDRVLLDMWKKVGCRWNLISRELNGRPAVHCRNRYASLKRIQKSLDPDGRSETPSATAPSMDPVNTPNFSTPSLSPNSSPCSTPPPQLSPCSPFSDVRDTDFSSNLGFPEHADCHELQQIQEINSLLVGGEQRGLSQSSVPTLSSTLYHLRLNESRLQPFHRGSTQLAKFSLADHPDMRVVSSGQPSPSRRASAPQLGFHVSAGTSHPIPRQLPYLYSCMYSECSFGSNNSSDIAHHLVVAHQRPDAASAFDMSSSFGSFAGMSSSRPTSDPDFSNGSTEPMFGFSSGPTSPSVSSADDLRFGFYQDTNLVKMENAAAGVDLVGWNNPGFYGLDTMGGFDTFGSVPSC